MQLFYASPALGVQSPTRQPSLLSNSPRSFYMRVSAHSMRAHHLGLARGETAAGKHSINIYIYIQRLLRAFLRWAQNLSRVTNKFPGGRWGEERTIVLRNQGDYLERAIRARFLYSRGCRERKREERFDKICMGRASVNDE